MLRTKSGTLEGFRAKKNKINQSPIFVRHELIFVNDEGVQLNLKKKPTLKKRQITHFASLHPPLGSLI